MSRKYFKILFVFFLLVILLIPTGISNICNQPEKSILNRNSVSINAGQPTTDGYWLVNIVHSGTSTSGTPYTNGAWGFRVNTNSGMTPEEKAAALAKEINERKDCPLTATANGATVTVTSDNGKIESWNSKSTDGQMVHGAQPKAVGCALSGVPTAGTVTIVADEVEAIINTVAKTIEQIITELWNHLTAHGIFAVLDATSRAIYISDIVDEVGMGTDDEGLIPLVSFTAFEENEPFNILVGMSSPIITEPNTVLPASIDITNFRFISDIYQISITDEEGWNIDPTNIDVPLMDGEEFVLELDIEVPPEKGVKNLITITATSHTEPWYTSTGLLQVITNNAPGAPEINGQINGKVGVEYTYTFKATDPDGDDLFYWILWGDGCPAVEWIGPYASGEVVTLEHTFTSEGTFTISAQAKDVYDVEGLWGKLEVTMPRSKAINSAFAYRFFERFLDTFLIIRQLLEFK